MGRHVEMCVIFVHSFTSNRKNVQYQKHSWQNQFSLSLRNDHWRTEHCFTKRWESVVVLGQSFISWPLVIRIWWSHCGPTKSRVQKKVWQTDTCTEIPWDFNNSLDINEGRQVVSTELLIEQHLLDEIWINNTAVSTSASNRHWPLGVCGGTWWRASDQESHRQKTKRKPVSKQRRRAQTKRLNLNGAKRRSICAEQEEALTRGGAAAALGDSHSSPLPSSLFVFFQTITATSPIPRPWLHCVILTSSIPPQSSSFHFDYFVWLHLPHPPPTPPCFLPLYFCLTLTICHLLSCLLFPLPPTPSIQLKEVYWHPKMNLTVSLILCPLTFVPAPVNPHWLIPHSTHRQMCSGVFCS